MRTRLLQIDAFTAEPFSGNPAAVCLMDQPRDAGWMQNVAAEMNLSETAFVSRRDDGFDLRWFTPRQEVKLCGHATLAAAHALWEQQWLPRDDAARFHTLSGVLTARWTGGRIEMDFPAEGPQDADAPPELAEVLGAEPTHVGRNRWLWLAELVDETTIRNLRPDFARMVSTGIGSAVVTSRLACEEFDFVSRFFAPVLGIDEDPVTGAAHCCLGPYWSARLGKTELRAFQTSARGGVLGVSVRGDRVFLTGRAVTVVRGELVL